MKAKTCGRWLALALGCAMGPAAKPTTYLTDPAGDAVATTVEFPPAIDAIGLSGGYTLTHVVFRATFRAASLGDGDPGFVLYLDTNQNDEGRGPWPRGTDYYVVARPGPGMASVREYGTFAEVGVVPVIRETSATFRLEIPLSLLGGDDGIMDFGLITSELSFVCQNCSVKTDAIPDDLNDLTTGVAGTLTESTTPLDPLAVGRLWTEVSGQWEFNDGSVHTEPVDSGVGPAVVWNPDVSDLARARLHFDALARTLGGEAKASLTGGLGARTYSHFVTLPPDLVNLSARAIAGHERTFAAVYTGSGTPPPSVALDVVTFLDGQLQIIDLNASEAPIYTVSDPREVWAEVGFEVTAQTLGGGSAVVLSASGRMAPAPIPERFGLVTGGPVAWTGAWSGPSVDPGTFGLVYRVNYSEVHSAAFSVPTDEAFSLAMVLEVGSYNERTAGLFDAVADFFSTGGLSVTTQATDVAIEEVTGLPSFALTGYRLSEAGLELTWESYPGRTYAVESAASPTGPWAVAREDVPAAGDSENQTTVVMDEPPGGGSAFYRIREEP